MPKDSRQGTPDSGNHPVFLKVPSIVMPGPQEPRMQEETLTAKAF